MQILLRVLQALSAEFLLRMASYLLNSSACHIEHQLKRRMGDLGAVEVSGAGGDVLS